MFKVPEPPRLLFLGLGILIVLMLAVTVRRSQGGEVQSGPAETGTRDLAVPQVWHGWDEQLMWHPQPVPDLKPSDDADDPQPIRTTPYYAGRPPINQNYKGRCWCRWHGPRGCCVQWQCRPKKEQSCLSCELSNAASASIGLKSH